VHAQAIHHLRTHALTTGQRTNEPCAVEMILDGYALRTQATWPKGVTAEL
jgi:hypothetical protein